jgi:hypothetical protein
MWNRGRGRGRHALRREQTPAIPVDGRTDTPQILAVDGGTLPKSGRVLCPMKPTTALVDGRHWMAVLEGIQKT